jgi:hypothetical protein
MMPKKKDLEEAELIKEWTLPLAATLGSSVRIKGILLEIRARLPATARKSLEVEGKALTLAMPENARSEFRAVSDIISKALETIEDLPVIPREIEDILTISTSERHRWLKDGRLPSAGTRSVKLRGRARQITFHVFDPRIVEDFLDRDLVTIWREEDVETAAENRRKAAEKAKLTRSLKKGRKPSPSSKAAAENEAGPALRGWDEFGRDGLLR